MSDNYKKPAPEPEKIMIIGGYGHVGLTIARQLAPLFANRVVIAGRNLDKATVAAAKTGFGTEGRALDVFHADDFSVLSDVAIVLVCLDQSDTRFVERCLSRSVHYVDISAKYEFLSKVEKLDSLAKENDATVILSVGVAPGLTNLLAAQAIKGMQQTDRIDILLELGLGDQHGKAAVEWFFDNLDAEYTVTEDAKQKIVRSLGESIAINLPQQLGEYAAYRFNFSDQHVISRTLGVSTVGTWVRFEHRFSTWLFAKLSNVGLARLLRRGILRKIGIWLFMNIRLGSNRCGVGARATGRAADGSSSYTVGIIGKKEALMTATIAAETIRQLLSSNPKSGVFHSEQVIALEPVIAALRKEIPDIQVSL
ncbi:MAG: saccharopine dehydrogenase NADP-binding domain-containing protein [Rhizobiaceae bacterium]|nr:saccharopine dehydrogenase NADP-binding domain-containing protein [Rhizobiaceae bacterium]